MNSILFIIDTGLWLFFYKYNSLKGINMRFVLNAVKIPVSLNNLPYCIPYKGPLGIIGLSWLEVWAEKKNQLKNKYYGGIN